MHEDEVWQLYDVNGKVRVGVGRDAKLGNPREDEGEIVGAVMILLYRHGENGVEFLWQKRAESLPEGGKWDFSAAGHVNLGESFVDAAVRETFEEIGAKVAPEELEFFFAHRLYSGMFVNHYIVDWDGRPDEFKFDDGEVTEVKWVPYSEMTKFRYKNAKGSLGHEEQIFIALDKWLKNQKVISREGERPNYAFIDGNNLYLGAKIQDINLDYGVFRLFLKNKYNVEKAFYFIGYDKSRIELYSYLKKCGYELVFKPTVKFTKGKKTLMKGNVDAELVLHAVAVEYENYNKAIVVTGDGDFACLMEFLEQREKMEKVIAPTPNYSLLLKRYAKKILPLKEIKEIVKFKGTGEHKSTGLTANALGTNQAGTVAGIRGRSKP